MRKALYEGRPIDTARTSMRASDAATRFGRAGSLLLYQAEYARSKEERWLAGEWAASLLVSVVSDALPLIELLDEERQQDVMDEVRALYQELRKRDLVRKLEQVDGRTPEEAAAFQDRARRLAEAT